MFNFVINESAVTSPASISNRSTDTVEFIAVLQEADRPNRNGRVYSKAVLEQALASPYVQERIRTKTFYCECNHPAEASVQRQMTIDQRNIACIIKEFWWEGNLLKGKVETCNTAIGRDMKGLVEQGCRVAFSLRAQGNVHQDPATGLTIVESPIQICTYDWVVNPSHDKAFLETICEDTYNSLTYAKRYQSKEMALCEAANIFDNGELIAINEENINEVEDYSKTFFKKIKKLDEMYVYSSDDEIMNIDESVVYLSSEGKTKKVVLEDYLVKDIRNMIENIGK